MRRALGLCAALLAATASAAPAKPSEHAQWQACRKDADCTSVELGCWYWQPVSKAHAEDMKA
ncbi:MAG: hypothetical protein KGL53_01925, partial [Elusimicrobia bacterium]|nr:hypothetical protein [Elusimicrobiota bacterium]